MPLATHHSHTRQPLKTVLDGFQQRDNRPPVCVTPGACENNVTEIWYETVNPQGLHVVSCVRYDRKMRPISSSFTWVS